ncbi:phosphopantetheine-binding protein [Kitasatospora sp. NPDC004240]
MTEMTDDTRRESAELWVLDACRDIGLRVGDAGSDFFESGGNSLAAMKLIARADQQYGEDALPPDDLFARSTVREIAESIVRNSAAG